MRSTDNMIDQNRLKYLVEYNDNGDMIWINFTSVKSRHIKIGSIIGNINDNGYRECQIDNERYSVHHLVWLYHYGYIPTMIDHKDQNKLNNKISNLRETNHSKNAQNFGNSSRNTSGVRGVHWDKNKNKWAVRMKYDGKYRFIGQYDEFDDAVCARLAGEQCIEWVNDDTPASEYVRTNIQ